MNSKRDWRKKQLTTAKKVRVSFNPAWVTSTTLPTTQNYSAMITAFDDGANIDASTWLLAIEKMKDSLLSTQKKDGINRAKAFQQEKEIKEVQQKIAQEKIEIKKIAKHSRDDVLYNNKLKHELSVLESELKEMKGIDQASLIEDSLSKDKILEKDGYRLDYVSENTDKSNSSSYRDQDYYNDEGYIYGMGPDSEFPHTEKVNIEFEENLTLRDLNDLYEAQIEALQTPYYREDSLREHLKRYIEKDTIEYEEHGYLALRILKTHENYLKASLAALDIITKDKIEHDLKSIPDIKQDIRRITAEINKYKELSKQIKKVEKERETRELLSKESVEDSDSIRALEAQIFDSGTFRSITEGTPRRPDTARYGSYSKPLAKSINNSGIASNRRYIFTERTRQVPEYNVNLTGRK